MIKCNLPILMAERKFSIQDVADKTGLSRTTISALVNENGKGIQFETLNSLCELFEVQPGELFTFESLELSLEYIDHKFTGPYEFEFTNINLDDEEKTIEDAYELTIKLSMKHNFKKFEEIIQVPFAFEKDKNNVVTDVYISKLHRKIYNFYGRDVDKIHGKSIWQIIEDFIIKLLENVFGLQTSFDLMLHY